MKILGLIGGMSWESTAHYYTRINQLVAERLGGLHSARLLLYSLDFDELQRLQHADFLHPSRLAKVVMLPGSQSVGAAAGILSISSHRVRPAGG